MRRGEPLAWGLVVTMTLHASLAVAIVLGHGTGTPPPAAPDVMVAKLVRLGKPRPKKLLPRKPTAKPPAPKPPPAIEPVPDPEKPEKKKAPERKPDRPEPRPAKRPDVIDAMQRARALAAAAEDDEEPEGLPHGVPEGTADTASEGDPYATEVYRRIKAGWRVADLVSDSELHRLRALVFLRLADDGSIMEHRIQESSGNRFFDASVLEAVVNVDRLPPPPPSLAATILNLGITLEFVGTEAQ